MVIFNKQIFIFIKYTTICNTYKPLLLLLLPKHIFQNYKNIKMLNTHGICYVSEKKRISLIEEAEPAANMLYLVSLHSTFNIHHSFSSINIVFLLDLIVICILVWVSILVDFSSTKCTQHVFRIGVSLSEVSVSVIISITMEFGNLFRLIIAKPQKTQMLRLWLFSKLWQLVVFGQTMLIVYAISKNVVYILLTKTVEGERGWPKFVSNFRLKKIQ